MFIGLHTLPLAPQGQLPLPGGYRQFLGERAYLTRGFDRNLLLLSEQAFLKIYAGLQGTNLTDPTGRLLSRLLLGSAVELRVDANGVVQLPKNLIEYAALDGEVVLLGQGDFCEIWAPALWEKQASLLGDGDANAARFAEFHLTLA